MLPLASFITITWYVLLFVFTRISGRALGWWYLISLPVAAFHATWEVICLAWNIIRMTAIAIGFVAGITQTIAWVIVMVSPGKDWMKSLMWAITHTVSYPTVNEFKQEREEIQSMLVQAQIKEQNVEKIHGKAMKGVARKGKEVVEDYDELLAITYALADIAMKKDGKNRVTRRLAEQVKLFRKGDEMSKVFDTLLKQ